MNEKNTPYDLIVIGAGSGLNVASAAASELGWKVAVVESGPMGGTCLNRGCIPSKIIIHAADVAETIARAGAFGISARIEGVDFKAVTRRASDFVDAEAAEIEKGITSSENNIDLYKARASFIDTKTIQAGDETLQGERFLIAAGTRPAVPPIPGLDSVPHLTSDEALRLEIQPKSLAVIGGGYIAVELGHFFGALGTELTIIEAFPVLIGREDADIAKSFTEQFSKKHRVLLGMKVARVEKNGSGVAVIAAGADGGEMRIEAEQLLVATGRASNADSLALERAGVKTNERGFIEVNEYMETSVPNIWALGDIVGRAPFKHGANFEARHVFAGLSGNRRAVDYRIMPHAIFSSPQIAGVGLTEAQANEKNVPHTVKRFSYSDIAMGKALEEESGFIKFILDDTGKQILGCHIMGPEASILIHEVLVVMTAMGGQTDAITKTIHIHPAMSELIERALLRG